MKRWILIKASEDGDPNLFLDERRLAALLNYPADFGVDRFLTLAEVEQLGDDANYWPEGAAFLVEFEAKVPEHLAATVDPDRLGDGHSRPDLP